MLSLIETESHLWERFRDGVVAPSRAADDPLLRHWQRARELGVQADGPASPDGIGHLELLARREREGELVHSVSSALDSVHSELARRGVLALLADRDGIVLHTVGGGRFLSSAAQTRLIEGACWAEAVRGTNAIGTALFDERSIHVRGRAHFERMNHSLFCYAAPIHDASGRVIAVLDFTGHVHDESFELARLLRQTVHDVERHLVCAAEARRPRSTQTLAASDPFAEIWGSDAALGRAKDKARIFARAEVPVMLLGETGTGKELFARAIHAASARHNAAFVAVNCGALPPDLVAAELFGHAPSAFTGASRTGQIGKLEAAHGGTLFLDEIAELDPSGQAALLRVLEDGSFYRVGEHKPRKVDLRVVCATCKDLRAAVDTGAFRADLYFRLAAAPVLLPSLRERTDRVELALHLLTRATRSVDLDLDARAHVASYAWPGNVRELKNALQHALLLAGESPLLRHADFPEGFVPAVAPNCTPSAPRIARRDELLDSAARETLDACGGNITLAAKSLGVARSTLYRMLRR